MALKIIFMGTPDFAVKILNSIIDSKHNVLAVYTQSPKKSNRGQKINISSVQDFSEKKQIKVRTPQKLDLEEKMFIQKLKPDVVIVVAYGKLIPPEILDIKNIKFINVHASLLPRWRGAAPIQRSIMEMDKETGISIMKIIPELDAGPYMIQEKIKIEKSDNFKSLSDKLAILGSSLTIKALDLIENNTFNFKEQDNAAATYAKKVDKSETEIKWNLPAKNLIAKINGLSPYPGVWFKHQDVRIKILKAIEIDQSGEI